MKREQSQEQPLKISCTSTKCESNLHCFKFHKRTMTAEQKGACRECGIKLIDWRRVHIRRIDDVRHTFESLKYEYFRHHYWHIEIDQRAINYARRKGKAGIRQAAEKRIRKYIAPPQPPRDGYQTPLKDNPIYYAQHATAGCCRKCIEYWHDIPQGRPMSEKEINYLVALLVAYIEERMPYLTESGEYVPKITARERDATQEESDE